MKTAFPCQAPCHRGSTLHAVPDRAYDAVLFGPAFLGREEAMAATLRRYANTIGADASKLSVRGTLHAGVAKSGAAASGAPAHLVRLLRQALDPSQVHPFFYLSNILRITSTKNS